MEVLVQSSLDWHSDHFHQILPRQCTVRTCVLCSTMHCYKFCKWPFFQILLLLFYLTANGGLPSDSDTSIRHNTQKYTYHTKHHTMLKQNTAHKAAWTMKGTLHTMSTTQKYNKNIRVPGYKSRGSGFDSWHYQILWEVVGLEQGPLSLVSAIEKLLERNSSGFGLESREYSFRNLLYWPRNTLYPQKSEITSLTSGGCSVGIVHSRTKATELFYFIYIKKWKYNANPFCYRKPRCLKCFQEWVNSVMREMDAPQNKQGCSMDARDGRLGHDMVCFDPTSNVGQFAYDTDHLNVSSRSSLSTIRANTCVFRGKMPAVNVPCCC
jgi:hypothetical protein